MTQAIEMNVNTYRSVPGSIVKRIGILSYGLLAYSIGCAGLFWLIFAMGGLAPVGISQLHTGSLLSTLLVDTGLIFLFGLQHSLMARTGFKKWITRYIPEAAERSTYMLMSGLVTITAIYFWQPLPGIVWSVENSIAQVLLYASYAIGWTYLLLATFVTNHFELMGLRQVYLYFRGKPHTSLPFTRRFMYRYSRHPMMLGVLVGMWAVPVMSLSHFIMALLFTTYIAVGISLEEADLVKTFGKTYRNYKKEIATFLPRVF